MEREPGFETETFAGPGRKTGREREAEAEVKDEGEGGLRSVRTTD